MDILESLFRWIHVVAGITWIGLLYFFNWVNGPFAATMDGDTKKKVIPELAPRALYWFRWGAAYTWVTGILLLGLVYYMGGLLADPQTGMLNTKAIGATVFVLIAPFIYDALFKSPLGKDLKVAGAVCFALVAVFIYVMVAVLGMEYRAFNIHVGGLFGTIMAFNVWMRIWPSQKKIINGVKTGPAADPAVVALAAARSRHNTYMSVPLVWTMINAHTTWASQSWVILLGVIAVGWLAVNLLYKKSAQVKGF